MSKVKSYQIMFKIKLVRKVLDYGFQKALEYADFGEEEEYTKSLERRIERDCKAT